jgi:hypothetical protein
MNKIYLQSTALVLNRNQIVSFLPDSFGDTIKERIEYIKKTFGENKIVKAYSIAHEGTARPTTDGQNKKTVELKFTEKALDWIKEKANLAIQKGLKFFDGHNPTNDSQTNTELGQAIATKKINHEGKKHIIAIGIFGKDSPERDISSMEFSVDLEKLNNGSDESIDSISGIALADSTTGQRAGFPDAKKLGEFQCFEFQANEEIVQQNKKVKMDVSTIKEWIRENGIQPQQLYTPTEIIGEVRVVDGKLEFDGGIPQFNNKILGRLKNAYVFPETDYKILQEKLNKIPELEKSFGEYKKIKTKQDASESLPTILKQRNFDESKLKYVNEIFNKKKILDNLDSEIDISTQINSKLDEIQDDYEFNFKTFGKPEIPNNVIGKTNMTVMESNYDY